MTASIDEQIARKRAAADKQAAGMTFDTEDLRRALSEVLNEQTADANGGQYTFASLIAGACRTRLKEGQQQ